MRLEAFTPEVMERVAIVVPQSRARRALEVLAATESFEPDEQHARIAARSLGEQQLVSPGGGGRDEFASRTLESAEDEWARRAAGAVGRGRAAVYAGWIPRSRVQTVANELSAVGGSVTPLPRPAGVPAPTLIAEGGAGKPFRFLIDTFGVVPYRSIDPALFAGTTYAVMFGMMFGDVADGALLIALGIYVRLSGRGRPLAPLSSLAIASGAMAIAFGMLYGEAFGPTELLPVLWLSPLDAPTDLLAAGLVLGSALLGLSYILGTANRWREGGAGAAAYSASGLAGSLAFLGGAALIGGWTLGQPALVSAGVIVLVVGSTLMFVGFVLAAGSRLAGLLQAVVELFDGLLRIASNVVSFSRLAAFGLTHAAIGLVVWDATVAVWGAGFAGSPIVAVFVFALGHSLSFALEVLVIGVQALRLEYYELFSRVMVSEGREFSPWRRPSAPTEVPL